MRRATADAAQRHAPPAPPGGRADAAAAAVMGAGLRRCRRSRSDANTGDFGNAFAVEVSEVARPRARRGGDRLRQRRFRAVRGALAALTGTSGRAAPRPRRNLAGAVRPLPRHRPAAAKFEAWPSTTPSSSAGRRRSGSRCRDGGRGRHPRSARAAPPCRLDGQVGWICPGSTPTPWRGCVADAADAAAPWVFDWGALRGIGRRSRLADLIGCVPRWGRQKLDMRWLGGEPVRGAAGAAPTGVRDADPAFWRAAGRCAWANRPDQFDEAAIDYCVTYEVSPPSWGAGHLRSAHQRPRATSRHPPPMSLVSEVPPASSSRADRRSGPNATVRSPPAWSCPASWSGDIGDR